jgi:hypothetical protein
VFKGDTLVLVKNYYSSVDDFAFQRSDSAQFAIKKATARRLVLVPANTNARNLARRAEYRFDNLQYIPAEKIRLNLLTMSYASNSTPNWQLTIDRHGNAAFSGPLPAQNQAGRFTGKLSRAQPAFAPERLASKRSTDGRARANLSGNHGRRQNIPPAKPGHTGQSRNPGGLRA